MRKQKPWQCECGHTVVIGGGLYQRKLPYGKIGYVCERCRLLIDFGEILDENLGDGSGGVWSDEQLTSCGPTASDTFKHDLTGGKSNGRDHG